MTLYEIISTLKAIALSQPNVRTVTDGSIYDVMNTTNSIQYDVVHFTQTKHISDETTDTYGFNIFYVSRLDDTIEDNRLQIQSIGKEILDNILRSFCENWSIEYPEIIYYPFTQKFTDLCAGMYCRLDLQVPKEIICADDYIAEVVPGKEIKLQNIGVTISENGLRVFVPDAEYDGIGEIRIVTDVPQTTAVLEDKEVEYSSNGEYVVRPDTDYDGMSSVAVTVNVADRYDEGYADGETDGKAEQKAKLVATSITANDTYTRVDGWSAITVNVPSSGGSYDEGYADGEAAQKAKLVATSFTENNTYTRVDGYSAVTVNIDTASTYNSGYTDGEAAQKAKLISTSVTQNNTYTRADGYSAVTVNIDTASTYNSGYTDGEAAQKAKLTTTSFTENDTYTVQDGWSSVTVNVPQTGSSQDLIANLQGDYYVIPAGTTHLRDDAFYGTDMTGITIPSSVTGIGADAFADCSSLESMTFEGDVPPTLSSTASSLGSTAYTFPIYVPCESVSAYITAFGSAYGSRVQCTEDPYLLQPFTIDVTSGGTIVWKANSDSYTCALEYSKDDGQTWTSITSTTGGTQINVNTGDKVQFRGNNATLSDFYDTNNTFSGTSCQFNVYGNIMSLLYSTGYTTATTLQHIYAFYKLFIGCTGLTSAKNLILPATTMTERCYSGMFSGCTNLTVAPELPATSITDICVYEYMFDGCSNLSTAPELPATTLSSGCYGYMFRGCTSLTSAPELPATTLVDSCYQSMFRGCTSLTSAPELPATTLTNTCYNQMFRGCTSLTSAPELPATTLADYCYTSMFNGCTSLNYIKCLATDISATNCTSGWVRNVASNGTFVKAASMTDWTTGNDGIPSNWTVENAV